MSNICKTHERSIKKTKENYVFQKEDTSGFNLAILWQMVHLPNMDKRHRVVLTLVTASVGSDVAWY